VRSRPGGGKKGVERTGKRKQLLYPKSTGRRLGGEKEKKGNAITGGSNAIKTLGKVGKRIFWTQREGG